MAPSRAAGTLSARLGMLVPAARLVAAFLLADDHRLVRTLVVDRPLVTANLEAFGDQPSMVLATLSVYGSECASCSWVTTVTITGRVLRASTASSRLSWARNPPGSVGGGEAVPRRERRARRVSRIERSPRRSSTAVRGRFTAAGVVIHRDRSHGHADTNERTRRRGCGWFQNASSRRHGVAAMPATPARAAATRSSAAARPSKTSRHVESPARFRRAGWRYPSRRTLA